MPERDNRNSRIVAELKRNALASAAIFARDCEIASLRRRVERAEVVIADLAERFEDEHVLEFAALGVTFAEHDGRLVLEQEGRKFVIRAREDMTFAADGVIIPLNPEFPVLDDDVYETVLGRVRAWAGASDPNPTRYFR
jgi:hypothetical protein